MRIKDYDQTPGNHVRQIFGANRLTNQLARISEHDTARAGSTGWRKCAGSGLWRECAVRRRHLDGARQLVVAVNEFLTAGFSRSRCDGNNEYGFRTGGRAQGQDGAVRGYSLPLWVSLGGQAQGLPHKHHRIALPPRFADCYCLTNSTRRFLALPSSLSLEATGDRGPTP